MQTDIPNLIIKRKFSKRLLLGLILLMPSLYTIFLMAREGWLNYAVYSRYSVRDCFVDYEVSHKPLTYVWHGQTVVLSDDYEKGTFSPDEKKTGRVKIAINGKDYSSPWLVEIWPNDHNVNRYWMQVMLVKFDDIKAHTERLVVLQSYPDFDIHEYTMMNSDALTCRALFIDNEGRVTEDVFPFSERTAPLYRTLLAGEVSPEELGFYSEVLDVWPSLLYPLLYPLVSGAVGLILTIVSIMKYRRTFKST